MKDVVGFVKAMNFEKPILIGHSMGAATVMRIGAEYPDLAKAIIMLNPMLGDFPGERGGEARNAAPNAPQKETKSPDRLSVSMFGPCETLVL